MCTKLWSSPPYRPYKYAMYQEKDIPPKGPYPPPDLEKQRFSDKQKTNKAMKQNTTQGKNWSVPPRPPEPKKSYWRGTWKKGSAKWSRFCPNPRLIVRPHTASLAVPCGQRQYWEELCSTPTCLLTRTRKWRGRSHTNPKGTLKEGTWWA